MPLVIIFIVVPIIEMWLLIEVGSRIGSLVTIGLVALTAIIGASLLRSQGVATLTRAQERLNSGEIPATELLEGLFLAIGGALLLTPGFVTDIAGFCCLLPPVRRAMVARLLQAGWVTQAGVYGQSRDGFGPSRQSGVYEGEFQRESPRDQESDADSDKNLPPPS